MHKLSVSLATLTLLMSAVAANAATPGAGAAVNPDRTMSAAQCAVPGDNARLWRDNISLADKLGDKGIKFDWMARSGNCLDVAVVAPNGTVSREIFDPNTLQRVTPSTRTAEISENAVVALT